VETNRVSLYGFDGLDQEACIRGVLVCSTTDAEFDRLCAPLSSSVPFKASILKSGSVVGFVKHGRRKRGNRTVNYAHYVAKIVNGQW